MAKKLKILCVHGISGHPTGGAWEGVWKAAIEAPLASLDPEVIPVIEFVYLDAIFDKYPLTPAGVLEALWKLGKSGLMAPLRQPRNLVDDVRWTAGMVVQWVENERLRRETRALLARRIGELSPDIVIGHSLGSLVCYDCFTDAASKDLIRKRRFVSCGSQIGNPFVVGNFAIGSITPLEQADYWYHLYNEEDDVFTAPIRLAVANYAQIDTFFDIAGHADHDVTDYMTHPRTTGTVWADAVMKLNNVPLLRRVAPAPRSIAAKLARKPQKRALLVGVNEYAEPSRNLAGCVNDAFLVSALLQESGFEAEDIRLVLDDRATSAAVRDRMAWLLEDVQDGDTRFFYFSGHGAQLPTYGVDERVDKVHETLVLHDFDWTKRRAFTDEEFYGFYSQLPYGARIVAVLDCCYSGGMTRGGATPVRGIDPPDDIRHRMLRWDAKREMWVARDMASPNKGFDAKFNPHATTSPRLSTHRLGQAMDLRRMPPKEFDRLAAQRGHKGPYMPILLYACEEDEYAFEYQHGSIAHGAFTYSLVKTLRQDRRRKPARLTFKNLVRNVKDELQVLGYEQSPTLLAPSSVMNSKVRLLA